MHFVLQIFRHRRCLTGTVVQGVLYALVYPSVFLIAHRFLSPVTLRLLFLALEILHPLFYIRPIGKLRNRVSRFCLPHNLFDMNHHICRIFNQRFIVRNKNNNMLPFADQFLQKFQCRKINII